jgi:hypothetical protein
VSGVLGLSATYILENNLKLKVALEELGREKAIALGMQIASDLNIRKRQINPTYQ